MTADRLQKLRIGFTGRCDAGCSFCYFVPYVNNDQLSLQEYICQLKIARGELGLKEVSITGGEPLLRFRDLVRFCAVARQEGVKPKVVSNGLILSNTGVLESLADAGMTAIQLSLHSGPSNKNLHDAILGKPGAFEKVSRLIPKALRIGLKVVVRYTMVPENLDDVVDCCRFVGQHGSPTQRVQFKVRECIEAGRATPELILQGHDTLARLRRVYSELLDLAKAGSIDLELTQPYHGPTLEGTSVAEPECRCGARNGVAYLDETGNVFPCQFLLHSQEWAIGNVRSHSISDIWMCWLCSEQCQFFLGLPACKAEGCRGKTARERKKPAVVEQADFCLPPGTDLVDSGRADKVAF